MPFIDVMIKWTTVEVTTVLTSDHLRRQGRALCHGPELGPGNVRVDGGQLAEGGEPAVRARLHPVTNQLERIQGGKEEKEGNVMFCIYRSWKGANSLVLQ